jgi:hypothetical protein
MARSPYLVSRMETTKLGKLLPSGLRGINRGGDQFEKLILGSVIRDDESDTFIPQLRSSNGYVSLIFLDASEVLTFNETDDPWFEGTPLMYSNHSSDSLSTKTPGVIGCITRRFYCNPSLPAGAACVNGFAHNTLETLPQIWNDSQDLSVIRPILSTLSPNYLDIWYYLRSVPTLLSRNTIMAGMQMDILPDDRWQAEREHLFRASLVSIQSTMTDYARGFWLGMPGLCSNGMQCWKNCRSQVRSPYHLEVATDIESRKSGPHVTSPSAYWLLLLSCFWVASS